MKVIPAIDLIDGKTVRLEQGQYDRKLSYDIDPIEAAKKWESVGAELIHVVDLDGAKAGRPVNLPVVEKIIDEVKVPVQTGGGYRTINSIRKALDKGVWRVIVGSRAFEDIDFAKECLETFGERVILSGDAKAFKLCVHGWEEGIDLDIFDMLRKFVSFGAKEIIYTDIQKDGMLTGPSIDNIKRILKEVDVNIISAGGVKTVEHIEELKKLEELGLTGAIVGRALYEGTIDLGEAINVGKADNPVS